MRARWTLFVSALLCLAVHQGIGAEPALTIYNQDFAVVRQTVSLDLKPGVNSVRFTDNTAHLEPSSVILRDPSGKRMLQILEQNYRADPVSQELLLSIYEGKTIDFLVQSPDRTETIPGKIVRSGYVPHSSGLQRYGQQNSATQMSLAQGAGGQPIIEVTGKLRFSLPGIPFFPSLADDTILKPTLVWQIESGQPGKFDAELSYVTGGMSWLADYNVVAPEQGDILEIVGWVTIDNQSGKTFENTRIKLMAGDVSKIQPQAAPRFEFKSASGGMIGGQPPVSEKSFDAYHLYTLHRPVTLYDRESKQVEFIRAAGVKSQRIHIYDGVRIDQDRYRGWNTESIRQDRDYGVQSNPVVWVMREFANSEANHLGIPLPQGRVRFYRRDNDGQLEFTGENVIGHTPRDETIRVYTGGDFDLVGERRRTDFRIDTARNWLDESFEIKLRNHKREAVEVRVVEHLYRGASWEIANKTNTYLKTDSRTIEFRIEMKANEERSLTYTVHYTW